MDRAPDNTLLERILAAPRGVVVLAGAAASGKTTAALALYRHYLDATGPSRCLLLAPNRPAANALARRLLESSPAGLIVSPQVCTFAALAGRILADAGAEAARGLSVLRRRLLLRDIVERLHEAGRLGALAAVAETPGLIVALDRAIAELKRAAVEPDGLGRALGRRRDKSRDLLNVYRAYQQHLHEAGTYDMEGLMWLARDRLASAGDDREPPGLAGLKAIAVDGFTDFTPTQLDILHLASRRLERVLIGLPCSGDDRERLWYWTRRTLDRIRRRFDGRIKLIELDATPGENDLPLRAVWEKLFDFDAAPGALPEGLNLIAAAGLDAEVAAVARRVKRLLADGAPAGSIAVLARSLEMYRPAVERIFAGYDIPVAAAPRPLTEIPVIRFVLDAASLAPRFEFRGVLGVIKNSFFRPQALGEFDGRSVATAEMLIRTGNVLGGRKAYALAAERLARRASRRTEDDDDDEPVFALGPLTARPEDLSAAAAMLERLFDAVEEAGTPAGLLKLADALDLRAAACSHSDDALVARDLRALAALTSAAAELDDPPPAIADFREALASVPCPPARGETLVDLLDVLDARALRYRHVFLMGLGEGVFPRRIAENPLLGEADRVAWAARGVVLDNRGDLTAREMLLFYLAVGRADATLTLSYLESDASGRPAAAGSFLLSLVEPFGGLEAPQVRERLVRIPPGQFIWPADEPATRQDAFNAAVAGLFREDSDTFGGALRWAVEHDRDRLARAAGGLWARRCRWRRGAPDAFDGRISEAPLLERLREKFGDRAVFSASAFNAFGQCPWQFFAERVLKLAPLDEPRRQLEAVSRGLFCHGVLFRVMTRLRDELGGPVCLAETDPPLIDEALRQAVADESERVERTGPPYPVLWRIQREQMRRQLSDYLLGFRDKSAGRTESLHVELGFGLPGGPKDMAAPASRDEPVTIETPAGTIRLRGKIDRVDRVTSERPSGLLVIDYKTGRLPTQADMNEGRNLQAPLYAAAAGAILSESCVGGVFHGIADRRAVHFSALHRPRGDSRPFEERMRAAMETVGRFVANMRAGRFDAAPTHDCPGWCPFRRICHYTEARAERKTPAGEGDRP